MAHKNQYHLYEEVIDGKTFEFEKMGARQATKMLLKISKIVGKPLGMIAALFADGKKSLDKSFDPKIISHIVEALLENVDEEVTFYIIETLTAKTCKCERKEINYDQFYKDDLFLMTKVLKAALEVQFGSFFAGAMSTVGIAAAPAPEHHQTPISNG